MTYTWIIHYWKVIKHSSHSLLLFLCKSRKPLFSIMHSDGLQYTVMLPADEQEQNLAYQFFWKFIIFRYCFNN